MPNVREFHKAFSGGEVTPYMYGRIDDSHYQNGAALMRNFIAVPQGPAENRPGTVFLRSTKSNVRARLIPFSFASTDTLVIEIGVGYIRFVSNGATVLNTPAIPIVLGSTSAVAGKMYSYLGSTYYCKLGIAVNVDPATLPANFYLQPSTAFEIPTTYADADLFSLHYVQSNDIVTIVHPNYKPAELRRIAADQWILADISFTASVAAPTLSTVTPFRGEQLTISAVTTGTPTTFTTNTSHQFIEGDSVYVRGCVGTGGFSLADGFYVVNTTSGTPKTQFTLKSFDTGATVVLSGTYTAATPGVVQFGSRISDIDNFYVVTSVTAAGVESAASNAVSANNNLYVNGSYNTLAWTSVSSAARYNVYKRQSGLYGYIGQTSALSFTDNNIGPDMGITPPIYETVFGSAGNYPAAVSYYEQRRVFAGTTNDPQYLWLTRAGTETDMSYSIPATDADRIAIRVSSREANTIRHVVPLTQLLLLTSAAEWRVSPANSDVLTPTTISVRPQAYVGANNVQPMIVNNTVVYCSARGGHVRELGYSWQAQGFVTGNLSLRAAHLFNGLDIADMTLAKSPRQILWFVSTNGKLLGLTYVPEEQVGAWHQHDTDGAFESVCAVAEGTEDAVYAVVRRTVGGATVRYVERFATRLFTELRRSVFSDSSLTYDGVNATATTVTLGGGTTWDPADTGLTVTSSASIFQFPATTDVNDAIVLVASDGKRYRCRITGTTSTTVAQVRVDGLVPAALRSTATASWEFARDSMTGLGHLEGKTVAILADGAVVPPQVVTGGAISLPRACSVVTVGLPYESDLQTLPMVAQIDGFGQGRMKNVNKAWMRVYRSSGIFVGPDAGNLVEAKQRTDESYGEPPRLKSDEVLVVMTPTWGYGGQVFVRQRDPLPLTILSMTIEVAMGG
jgi:hypothetical protein